MRHIAIVGATSAIAEQCARIWVREPVRLSLLGRDGAALERIAQDLRIRSPKSDVRTLVAGFIETDDVERAVARSELNGPVDLALIAHGELPLQSHCEADLAVARRALEVNGVSAVLFSEAYAQRFAQRSAGTLGIIGSVAGDRGRRSNYVYGAAKALVARHAEGLQHRFAGTPVRIVLIKPGPTDTPMTARLKASGRAMADPADVAADIVAGLRKGSTVIYTPGRWRYIMLVLRHMPAFLFNRLDL